MTRLTQASTKALRGDELVIVVDQQEGWNGKVSKGDRGRDHLRKVIKTGGEKPRGPWCDNGF